MHKNSFLLILFFFSYFSLVFFLPFSWPFFSIFLSLSARQRWTAQQNGPSIEGPEGPRPTPMTVSYLKILSEALFLTHRFLKVLWCI